MEAQQNRVVVRQTAKTATPEPRFAWTPQPGSQTCFMTCPAFECLYHGTRGPGKSDALLMDFAQHVGEGFGAAWRGVLFRRSYPDLREMVAKSKQWFGPAIGVDRYNETKSTWTFPDGEQLLFRQFNTPDDYWKFHGHEFPWIAWEELTTWSIPDGYEAMMACCRSSNADAPRKVRATCNPYGVGHNWVKARFIDASPPGVIARDDEGRSRVHIFGSLAENRVLLEADPGYVANLRADTNENRRKAWLQGSWDIVAGGMFDDLWRPEIHVVEPFEIPPSWRIDRSFDWGSTAPFSVGWWAESDGTDITLPDGTTCPTIRGDIYRIAEWYGWNGKPNEGCRMLTRQIGEGIKERDRKIGPQIKAGPADNQIFAEADGKRLADDMAAAGVSWVEADKSPGSRKVGAEKLRALLTGAIPVNGAARERPGLFVFETCRHFIRTVPVLPRSDKDPDDVDSDAEDHVYDETRYRITARKPASGPRRLKGL